MALSIARSYFSYAKEKVSQNVLPAIKKGSYALVAGLKTSSAVVIFGILGQMFANIINQDGSNPVIIDSAKTKHITIDESMQEMVTRIGRIAAILTIGFITTIKLSKEDSFINKLGYLTYGILTFKILSETQIIGKALFYMTQETIDLSDTLGRNLPNKMGVVIDPFICQLMLSTAVAIAALSTRVHEKLGLLIWENYMRRDSI